MFYGYVCIVCASSSSPPPIYIYIFLTQKPSSLIYFPLSVVSGRSSCVVFFRHDENRNDDGWNHTQAHRTTSNMSFTAGKTPHSTNQTHRKASWTKNEGKKIHHLSWSTTICCSPMPHFIPYNMPSSSSNVFVDIAPASARYFVPALLYIYMLYDRWWVSRVCVCVCMDVYVCVCACVTSERCH